MDKGCHTAVMDTRIISIFRRAGCPGPERARDVNMRMEGCNKRTPNNSNAHTRASERGRDTILEIPGCHSSARPLKSTTRTSTRTRTRKRTRNRTGNRNRNRWPLKEAGYSGLAAKRSGLQRTGRYRSKLQRAIAARWEPYLMPGSVWQV